MSTDQYTDIELKDILELRENVNNAYDFVYDCVLRCVVGKAQWKALLKNGSNISNIVSVSDEAFCLLVLDNGWDRWTKIVKENITCSKKCRKMKSKYTNENRIGPIMFDGWKIEGLEKYNDYVYQVLVDRETHPDYDSEYTAKLAYKNGKKMNQESTTNETAEEKRNRMLQLQQLQTFNECTESLASFRSRYEAMRANTDHSSSWLSGETEYDKSRQEQINWNQNKQSKRQKQSGSLLKQASKGSAYDEEQRIS